MKLKRIDSFYVEISETSTEVQILDDSASEHFQESQDKKQGYSLDGDELVGGLSEKFREKAVDVKQTIACISNYVKGAFEEANQPDEITANFGIKFTGEQGIPFITKGSAEATIGVEVKWKKSVS